MPADPRIGLVAISNLAPYLCQPNVDLTYRSPKHCAGECSCSVSGGCSIQRSTLPNHCKPRRSRVFYRPCCLAVPVRQEYYKHDTRRCQERLASLLEATVGNTHERACMTLPLWLLAVGIRRPACRCLLLLGQLRACSPQPEIRPGFHPAKQRHVGGAQFCLAVLYAADGTDSRERSQKGSLGRACPSLLLPTCRWCLPSLSCARFHER